MDDKRSMKEILEELIQQMYKEADTKGEDVEVDTSESLQDVVDSVNNNTNKEPEVDLEKEDEEVEGIGEMFMEMLMKKLAPPKPSERDPNALFIEEVGIGVGKPKECSPVNKLMKALKGKKGRR